MVHDIYLDNRLLELYGNVCYPVLSILLHFSQVFINIIRHIKDALSLFIQEGNDVRTSSNDGINMVDSTTISSSIDSAGKVTLRKALKSFEGSDASSAVSLQAAATGDVKLFDAHGAAYHAQFDFSKAQNPTNIFSFGRDSLKAVENDAASSADSGLTFSK